MSEKMADNKGKDRMKKLMDDLDNLLDGTSGKPSHKSPDIRTQVPSTSKNPIISNDPSILHITLSRYEPRYVTGYVLSNHRLTIFYEVSVGFLDFMRFPDYYGRSNWNSDISLKLEGPGLMESIPGLPSDQLSISGVYSKYLAIRDTQEGGEYNLTLDSLVPSNVKVKLKFNTGLWTLN
jgi:hypothetical protein